MKLFLSWSGEVSYRVATSLRGWLPYFLQPVKPFLSGLDISKGDRWSDVLTRELKEAGYGIICVTPHNIHKPWLNFEAGVLSGIFDRAHLTPFLFRVKSSDVSGPLAQFQSTVFSEADVLNLICSINNRLAADAQLDHEVLKNTFHAWWGKLEGELNNIPFTVTGETQTSYDWLYTVEDLPIHHYEMWPIKSIWIITSDIFEFAKRESAKSTMNENMQKGVAYRYFIPDHVGKEDVSHLKQLADSNKGKLECGFFDQDSFRKLAVTDYIIINPDAGENYKQQMFLKLPSQTYKYWIEGDERSTVGLIDRFRDFWEKCHFDLKEAASKGTLAE